MWRAFACWVFSIRSALKRFRIPPCKGVSRFLLLQKHGQRLRNFCRNKASAPVPLELHVLDSRSPICRCGACMCWQYGIRGAIEHGMLVLARDHSPQRPQGAAVRHACCSITQAMYSGQSYKSKLMATQTSVQSKRSQAPKILRNSGPHPKHALRCPRHAPHMI